MEKSKRLLTLVAIVSAVTISTVAFAALNGDLRFLFPNLDLDQELSGIVESPRRMTSPFTLTDLPEYFNASVIVEGSGYTGQPHTVYIMISHTRPDSSVWLASGFYTLNLESNGTVLENITTGFFTYLRRTEPQFTQPCSWTPSSLSGIYDIVLNINNILWSILTEYTINATASPGGTISLSGLILVEEGAEPIFLAIAADGYVFDSFLIDEGPPVFSFGFSSYTFDPVYADHTIEAVFAELGYTYALSRVIMNVGPPISITGASFNGSDPNTYLAGETVSFVINATMGSLGPTYDIQSIKYTVRVAKVGDTSKEVLVGVTQTFDPAIPPLGDFAFIGSFTQPNDVGGDWEITINDLSLYP